MLELSIKKLEYYFVVQFFRKARILPDDTSSDRCVCRMTDLFRISIRILIVVERYTEAFSTFSRIRNTWLPLPHTVDKSRDGRVGCICAYNYFLIDVGRKSRHTNVLRLCDSTLASSSFHRSRSNLQARGN